MKISWPLFYWQFERHETALERRSELKEDVIVALRRNVFALVERCIIFDYYKQKRKRERKYNRSDQNNISTDKTHKLATGVNMPRPVYSNLWMYTAVGMYQIKLLTEFFRIESVGPNGFADIDVRLYVYGA